MKSIVSLLFLLIALNAQNITSLKTSCIQQSAYPNKTLNEQKKILIEKAKQESLEELYGTLIVSSTDIVNGKLKSDEIKSRAVGAVRVKGNPGFYNGKNLGEICADVTSYITPEDIIKFSPTKVSLTGFCFNDTNVAMKDIKTQARLSAYREMIVQYKPSLKNVSKEKAESLIHGFKESNSNFDFEKASYCFNAVGTILPYELEMGGDLKPNISKKNNSKNDNIIRLFGIYKCGDYTTSENKLFEDKKVTNKFYRADEFEGEYSGTYLATSQRLNFYNNPTFDKVIKSNSSGWRTGDFELQYVDNNTLNGKITKVCNDKVNLKKIKVLPSENYQKIPGYKNTKWFGMYNCGQGYTQTELTLNEDGSATQRLYRYGEFEGIINGTYMSNGSKLAFYPNNKYIDTIIKGNMNRWNTVPFNGNIKNDYEFKGTMNSSGCSNIYLRKVKSLPSEDLIK